MCVAYIFFVLDSHLATLWESNCPFGFLLVRFPLGSIVISCLCFFPSDVSDGMFGIIVSIPDHCLPFYFVILLLVFAVKKNKTKKKKKKKIDKNKK